MENMKRGFITQINRNDNLGVIKENSTQTEWLFFLDEIPKEQMKETRVHTEVTFTKDESYEQFVAQDLKVTTTSYRKVV